MERAEGHGAFEDGFGGRRRRDVLAGGQFVLSLTPIFWEWSVVASTAFV